MDELIDYLIKLAESYGINVEIVHEAPDFPSMSFHKAYKMIINMNWHNQWEIPFTIGHEMGHLINGDIGTYKYQSAPSCKGTIEHRADMYSLRVIYDYAMRQIDTCVEPGEFMDQYGIPDWMLDDTVELFKKNNDLVF